MSYVDSNLIPGESVVYRTSRHWIVLLSPALFFGSIFFCFGITLCLAGSAAHVMTGIICSSFGALLFFVAYTKWKSIEMAVTNRRIVAKQGVLRTRSLEMSHSKVESIQIDQGLVGKALNYGTVVIRGTGGTPEPFKSVRSPFEFRRHVQGAIDPIS